jgi:hypothetical protein
MGRKMGRIRGGSWVVPLPRKVGTRTISQAAMRFR